jgi:hypothetical protein
VGIVVWIHIQVLYFVPLVFISVLVKWHSFFIRMENRRVEQVLLGDGTSGRGEDVGRSCRRVNMV